MSLSKASQYINGRYVNIVQIIKIIFFIVGESRIWGYSIYTNKLHNLYS